MTGLRASWRHDGERKPRVLVADDNALILSHVSSLLARNFDLVAAVTDGRQALDASRRLDPDVVVLDVSMPGLDGFQTARELTRSGSRAKIVMLTMHLSDEHLAAAIDAGADGYVTKRRMLSDLERAIDHVVDGRLFVPSVTSLLSIAPAPGLGRHAVQFGSNDHAFLDGLSRVLAAALRRGDVVAIVATEATRAGVAERLFATGCDVAHAEDRGTYISLDARVAAAQVMEGGRFDASRLAVIVDDLERQRLAGSASHLTIVGAIAPQVCRDGDPETALQVEHAWDDLTRSLPFLTVCFYSMDCFRETDPDVFPGICATHSVVCHAHDA
jgi:DNA-binding NarL/FixJ family response regulator